MAKSGTGNNGGNGGNGGKGGTNPGFSVSFDSGSGTFTPSGPTTPTWGPGNTPGTGGTNPAGLNNSENNKDSKNNINLNEAAAKAEAAKKNAEKSNDENAKEYAIIHRGYLTYKNNKTPGEMQKELASRPLAKNKEAFKKGTPSENNTPADTSAPATPATTPATPETNNTPGGNLGGETGGIVSGAAPTNTSDATNKGFTYNTSDASNTGVIYRGGTVTDNGTGGSISSSVTPPSRNASSIGLGVYNNDRANYDQDNWNRGMESESSSLVSDEECKAFAKRAFMENSEPFKIVKTTIVKKV